VDRTIRHLLSKRTVSLSRLGETDQVEAGAVKGATQRCGNNAASRGFGQVDNFDRVAMREEIVTIECYHTMIAKIMPLKKTMTASQALAGLAFSKFTPEQAIS
jgi:hypothetical protein